MKKRSNDFSRSEDKATAPPGTVRQGRCVLTDGTVLAHGVSMSGKSPLQSTRQDLGRSARRKAIKNNSAALA